MIICFLGKKASGKTTASQILVKEFDFLRVAFADRLKEVASDLFCIPLEKMYNPNTKDEVVRFQGEPAGPFNGKAITIRDVLQWWGTEGCRYLWSDIWVHHLSTKLDLNPRANYVIDDCRFLNEQKMLKEKLDTIFTRIIRLGFDDVEDSHQSEAEVDKLRFNCIINNDKSLERFKDKVREWYNIQKM